MSNQVTTTQQTSLVAVSENELLQSVSNFVKTGINGETMKLPEDYDVNKAVKNFMFALVEVKDIGEVKKESILKAAHEMVTKGIDLGKKQAALIKRGNSITLQMQYFGNVKMAKSYNPSIKDINASVIYEGDKVKLIKEHGRTIIQHETSWENINDSKIIGAYATVEYADGTSDSEIMNKDQINKSWLQSSNTQFTVHKKFPVEMSKKTVINRLCKRLVNMSDDNIDILEEKLLEDAEFENDEIVQNQQNNKSYNIDTETNTKSTQVKNVVEVHPVEKEESAPDVDWLADEVTGEIIDDTFTPSEFTIEEEDEIMAQLFSADEPKKVETKKEKVEIKVEKFSQNQCEKCGKELTERSIAYYNDNPDKKRYCFKCNQK